MNRRYQDFRKMGLGAETSLSLARAEAFAKEIGLSVTWEHDEYACHDELEDPRDKALYESGDLEILHAFIQADGETLASLGGIWISSSSRDYRRQVEAELFLEAIETLKRGEVA